MAKKQKKNPETLKALSRMSGLSKSAVKEIAKQVIENNNLLISCSFHIFEPIDDPSLSRIYECKNCKGRVRSMQKIWYERGLDHSKLRKKEN